MVNKISFLCFEVNGVRIGIHLDEVEKVVGAAKISPVPDGPEMISGLVDYHGMPVAVINLRKKFLFPARSVSPDQAFIIVKTQKRHLVLVADRIEGIMNIDPAEIVPSYELDSTMRDFGVLRTREGIVIMFDSEKFLCEQDEVLLSTLLTDTK